MPLPGKSARGRWIAGCARRAVHKNISTHIRWLLAIAGALLAATAYAHKVTTDANRSAPFGSYKTYGWTDGTPAPTPLAEQRIHGMVGAQLAARGLAESHTPDLFVATHAVTAQHPQLIVNGFDWGLGGTASVETYTVGTLVVDLYDAHTKQLVWRGVATDSGSDKPEKNTQRIDKALGKMFSKYPPGV